MASETTSQETRDVAPPAETEQQHIQASPSSPVGPPTGIDTSFQHAASTPPDDGDEVPAERIKKPSEVNRDDPNVNVVELPPRSPTFKEQVYGYAKLIHGTVLGQPNVKEQGTQVLRGEQGIPLRRGSPSSK
ncbi:hypothetical protein OG21DRAFT_823742 [Imleria badia]|nr:hypothetical protein OG21DRAFT_823742 [Imleria badia]